VTTVARIRRGQRGQRGRRGRRALTIAICVLAPLGLPASAGAHAVLLTSSPHWNAVLRSAPPVLRLVYDENVVPRFARVTVSNARGQNVAGAPRVTGRFVAIPLSRLPKSSYTVRWHMVAFADGHVTEGAWSFGVQTNPLPPAPVSGNGIPIAPQLLAWLQFLGVALAGGALVVRALVWRPAARVLGEDGSRDAPIALWIGVAGAVIGLHAGLLAFLVDSYPIVGGGVLNYIDTQIIPIRVGTHVGQAWTLMTFAWLAVLALLIAAWVTPRRREPLLLVAGCLALATAFGLSYASHSDSVDTLTLLADYAHLVASALWVGGLVSLALIVGVVRPFARPAREAFTRACLVQWSGLAIAIVVQLAVAGGYLALRELPNASSLFTTAYGRTLLVKSAITLGAIALGGYHHRIVVPRIAGGEPAITIRRTLTVEATLLLAALVLAAILSQTAPPS
jgi:copper transport protein